jgi:polar amino acid transport system substrate-binding protein
MQLVTVACARSPGAHAAVSVDRATRQRPWLRGAVLAALAATLALLAAPAPAEAAVPTKRPGVLMVGLSMPVPNFQFGVVIGSEVVVAEGLEIDLIEAIARRLGVPRVEYVNETGFLPIIDGRPKPYDLAIAEATITPEREQRVDYSIPYMRADQGVLMARQYASRPPRTLAAVRRLRLCSGRGTTGVAAIRDHVRPVQPPLLLENQRRVFDALRRGRCAAAVYDAPILAAVKAAKPNVYGKLIGRIPTDERYGIVFEQGSPLRSHVDRVLGELIEAKTVQAIRDRWLGTLSRALPVLR